MASVLRGMRDEKLKLLEALVKVDQVGDKDAMKCRTKRGVRTNKRGIQTQK